MTFSIIVSAPRLVGLMLASPVMAQEVEDADEVNQQETSSEAAETEGRTFTDQIVVTATRQEELSSEVPAPVTVITSEEIEMLQPEKMADLFKTIPGVEIQGEGPFRGIPVIRGLTSNRVLILVDGQRLNNSRESTDFAGIQPALVNLGEVERIEVLRGPASVQYGSDAIGGVVNIITRKPNLAEQEFKVSGAMSYEYGTNSDSQNGEVRVHGAGKGMGFQIGASIQDVDDYTAADGAHEDERYTRYTLEDDTVPNSGMTQKAFDAGLSVLTGDRGVFKVNAEVVRTEDIGFPGFALDSNIQIFFPTFDRDKIAAWWDSGKMGFLDDLSLSAWYQSVDKESVRNLDFGMFFQNQFTRSEIDSLGFNAQGTSTAGVNHLTYGLDFYQDELHDTALTENPDFMGGTVTSDEVVVPDSTQRGLGLYVSDRISATDRLTVSVGLRGDTFSFDSDENDDRYSGNPIDVTDSALSGNLGVVYSVTEHVNLTGLIARGFRTPNMQERTFYGFATTGDTYILQNPELDPETSWNYEVGFKARYETASGGLNFFYNDLSDFIGFVFLDPDDPRAADCPPIPGVECSTFDNIDKARIWGIELDLEWIFARWWSVFGTFAYLEGDDETTGEPLPYIAPWKVTAGIRYQRSSWWAEADLRHLGSQDRLPPGDPDFDSGTDSFTVFDLRGGYDFAFGLGVLMSLENIFDELYNEPFNNRPEPGRNLRATLRYRF
jgi:hemoglobin/transferrin/lactoferrin receptor protein